MLTILKIIKYDDKFIKEGAMENNDTKEVVNENNSINNKNNLDNSNKNKPKKIKFITKDSLKDFTLWVVVSLILFFVMEYLSRRSRIEKVEVFLKDNKNNLDNSNKNKPKKIKFITKDSLKDFNLWVVVSLILFFVMEYLSRRSRIEKVEVFLKDNTYATVINILLILGITGIIFFVKHKKAVLWLISFLFIGLAVVNRMILEFRGMPVAFMDLYALQDGLSIASRFINTKMIIIFMDLYALQDGLSIASRFINKKMIIIAAIVIILFIAGLIIMWKLDKKSKRFNGISNIIAWMLSILVFAVSIGPIKKTGIIHNIGWDVQATY